MYVCMLRRQMAQFQCGFKRNLVFSDFKGTWLVFFFRFRLKKKISFFQPTKIIIFFSKLETDHLN